jgi:hypothetical protein
MRSRATFGALPGFMFIGISTQQFGPQQFRGLIFISLTGARLTERHKPSIVILRVLDKCLAQRAAIIKASRRSRLMARLKQRRNYETHEQPNHNQDDNQFHHGKSMASTGGLHAMQAGWHSENRTSLF